MSTEHLSDQEIDYKLALRSAARNYSKSLVLSAVTAAVGFAALWITVSLDAGILFCVGIGLGVLNSQLVQRSLVRAVTEGRADRKSISFGVLRRLSLITLIAVGIAVLYQPTGLLVFIGLMVFQMLSLATVLGGLARQVRRS
jgi:predicted RND superfamily exporter protein